MMIKMSLSNMRERSRMRMRALQLTLRMPCPASLIQVVPCLISQNGILFLF